jgi:hypothetical protein
MNENPKDDGHLYCTQFARLRTRGRVVRGSHHGTLVHRCWPVLGPVNAVGSLHGGEDQHHEDGVAKSDAVVMMDEVACCLAIVDRSRGPCGCGGLAVHRAPGVPDRTADSTWIPDFRLLAVLAAGRLS